GATTVWERWNSYTIEKGFGDVGMNSFNHYAYGAVYEWMMGYMVGIRPDTTKPGFEHFVLDVRPDFRTKNELPCGQKNITSASGYYDCAFGRISSSWNTEKGFAWNIDIPEGASATVSYPCTSDRNFICVNGEAISLENLGATKKNGKIVFELKSGKYNLR
ncbi:MAG: alpha-rhamnosidase, partial [Clostridia bacterium]|nr:alpha-rhamnosidase [Clostridia bacterium]